MFAPSALVMCQVVWGFESQGFVVPPGLGKAETGGLGILEDELVRNEEQKEW